MNCLLICFISLYLIVNGENIDKPQQPQCTLSDGKLGKCIEKKLCAMNETTIRNGSDLVKCENEQICCDPKMIKSININLCGTRLYDAIPNSNATETKYGEFPWMVAILIESTESSGDSKKYDYICGGSLIHPKVVVTAAHCFDVENDGASYIIRAGEWDTKDDREEIPHQEKAVTRIVIHDEFYRGSLVNNIALLFLDTPVTLNKNVIVVCTPTKEDYDPVGDRCLTTGWGKKNFGKSTAISTILKKAELPVVDRAVCEKSLRTTRLGPSYLLHRSFICAGGEKGIDTCTGDGGSSLVCPVSVNDLTRYIQYGIVSWGIGCGDDGIPSVYTKLSLYAEWINDQMTLKGLTPYKSFNNKEN